MLRIRNNGTLAVVLGLDGTILIEHSVANREEALSYFSHLTAALNEGWRDQIVEE